MFNESHSNIRVLPYRICEREMNNNRYQEVVFPYSISSASGVSMLLHIGITAFSVAVLSLTECCGKKPASEPDPKESPIKLKSTEAVAELKDTKSTTSGDPKKKNNEKLTQPVQKPPPPATLPEAGADDVGYESCPDMTPEELAKVVAAPK
ncbi:unnamed protein product [Angiostrongylus costaricensis]|uniref:Uncharacterized protein n=1 Tax=Angiostrongylus costaricensis TaxID=334426 RepID=A0A0R3PML7_ANGCS|nr:unnamed protein product [Angiostrongylus costaricensis]